MYLAHLEKLSRTRIEDVLVEEGILERPRVEEAQAEQEHSGKQLGEILIEREIVSDYDFAKLVCSHYALPFLDVTNYSTRREVLEMLPADFCARHALLPLDQFGTTMTLAVCEMPSQELVEQIVAKTNLTPFLFVAVRRNVLMALDEEKKRGPRRTVLESKMGKKGAGSTVVGSSSPSANGGSQGKAPANEELPVPELELPQVSMKLMTGIGKIPVAPSRPAGTKEPTGPVGKTSAGSKPVPAAATNPGSALSWMDNV